MFFKCRFYLCLLPLLVFLVTSAPVQAASNLFVVQGIEVDETAKTATIAREKAMMKAQKDALTTVLKRLTVQFDWAYLPDLTPKKVADYIQDVVVLSEKNSAVRYLATLQISIKPEAAKTLLKDEGIPFTESLSPPVLALPVYRSVPEGPLTLWDTQNPWWESFSSHRQTGGLVPVVTPLGDLQDIGAIDAAKAVSGDTGALQAIADRYHVDKIYLAEATRMLDGAISVSVYEAGSLPLDSPLMFQPDAAGKLTTAVAGAFGQLEELWKRQEVVQFAMESSLVVVVPLSSLADWLTVKEKLGAVDLVTHFDLEAMKKDRAQVTLFFSGSAGRLVPALARENLFLSEEGGFWTLRAVQ